MKPTARSLVSATVLVPAVLILAAAPMPAQAPVANRGPAAETPPASDPRVRAALDHAAALEPETIEEQVALCEIPAPPFGEEARAAAYRDRLAALGLADARIDAEGNAIATRPGTDPAAPTVVLSGHLDTVFPEGTDVSVSRDGTVLKGPGIGDDCRGLAVVLAVARTLQETGLATRGTVHFVGTVGEEGAGNLRGVRHLLTRELEGGVDYFISVDGAGLTLTKDAVGSVRYRVSYLGPGGHSYGAFGMPSPIHALGRAIAKVADFRVPSDPKVTFNVGVVRGGTSVNSIAFEASMDVDMRSVDPAALAVIEAEFLDTVRAALEEENGRWRSDVRLTLEVDTIGIRPAGGQPADAPIVRAGVEAARALGFEPRLTSASTDANLPISLGIPAVTIDGGGSGSGAHSLGETFDTRGSELGTRWALLYTLTLAGVAPSEAGSVGDAGGHGDSTGGEAAGATAAEPGGSAGPAAAREVAVSVPGAMPREEAPYDVLITGATVLDGTGSPGYRADVALSGDRIARISREPIPASEARRVVDAAGKVVAPGFIDLHAHLDPLLRLPGAESHVRQGVTTALGGPDGGSPWPIGDYLDSAQAAGLGMNVAFLAGHNTIRRRVMGMEDRAPTAGELERMRAMVRRAMGEGAWGLSTGLKYLPGAFSETDEVVALAEAAADSGGIYTSHLREEGLGLIEAVAEAIEIGRRARIPVVLTHHKAVGQPMWGASVRTLAMVDSAVAAGVDVSVDQYPYTATYTGIGVLVPAWAMAGGDSAFLRRLEEPATRDSIVAGIVFNILNDRGGGDLRRVQFARVEWMPELEGKTLHDWALMKGLEPTPETGAELVIEAIRRGGASAIYHVLDEGDIERIMRHPRTMIASDGRLTQPGEGHPHPRWYGTFPRVLGHYVRERGVLRLEEAVHKMTGLPAARIGLESRGLLREGWLADVVVFDPATVADLATFEDPHRYPVGIEWVFVNGVPVVEEGRFTDARPGRVLRRPPGRTREAPRS